VKNDHALHTTKCQCPEISTESQETSIQQMKKSA